MGQFDVHRLPDGIWVVDVQSDLIATSGTRLAIPLVTPDDDATQIARLNPQFVVDGETRLLATQLAAAVSKRSLGPPLTSLADHEYEIKAALDMLISGF